MNDLNKTAKELINLMEIRYEKLKHYEMKNYISYNTNDEIPDTMIPIELTLKYEIPKKLTLVDKKFLRLEQLGQPVGIIVKIRYNGHKLGYFFYLLL
jgi:hypothetical protein